MRRSLTVAVVVAVVLATTACGDPAADGGAEGGAVADGRQPVVVDTDMGPDDVVALLYLLHRPEVEVRAITVAGSGLAHCGPGTERAAGLLALAGVEGVPVACGREEPLAGYKAFPTTWRLASDEMAGMALPAGEPVDERPAVAVLAEVLAEAETPVRVVTLGPLTTLAELLRSHPELAARIADVHVMGGALDVPGNILQNEVAEWNVWVDPVAADEVLDAGLDLHLVPLDATNDVPQTVHLYETLARHHDTPASAAWFDYLTANRFQVAGTQYLWDEATVALLVHSEFATWDPLALDMDQGLQETRGRTVRGDGGEVQVARAVDRDAFERDLLATLLEREVDPVRAPVDLTVVQDDDPDLGVHTSPSTGDVVVEVLNHTDAQATAAIVRLLGDATEADLRAVPDARAPEWVEVVHDLTVEGGDELTAVLPFEVPGTYWVVTVTTMEAPPSVLGRFEVAPPS